jgi:hypothetical protein
LFEEDIFLRLKTFNLSLGLLEGIDTLAQVLLNGLVTFKQVAVLTLLFRCRTAILSNLHLEVVYKSLELLGCEAFQLTCGLSSVMRGLI